MAQNVRDSNRRQRRVPELVVELANREQAKRSSNSGSGRPSYATAGTKWLKTGTALWTYSMAESAAGPDIPIGVLDSTNNVWRTAVSPDGDELHRQRQHGDQRDRRGPPCA